MQQRRALKVQEEDIYMEFIYQIGIMLGEDDGSLTFIEKMMR